jgi:hypothetical protein
MKFRFQNLDGFHEDIREAIAANPAILAGFVCAEIDYKVAELEEPIKLNQHSDTDLADYISWLQSACGAAGPFPAQALLSDTPLRRKEWAQRHIDAEQVAEQITAMPEAMLTEFHPVLEVWSEAKQAGMPINDVVTVCHHCQEPMDGAPRLCQVCQRHVPYPDAGGRLYPFHQRLSVEDVVVVNIMLTAIDPSASMGRLGYWAFNGAPPADILSLTRLLFDRGADLEVAYLRDRIEIFHKPPGILADTQEHRARELLRWAIPTAANTNPLPAGLLPADAPTAFDLPKGRVLEGSTGVMDMLSKLSKGGNELTMEDALAFQDAVHQMVGKPKDTDEEG